MPACWASPAGDSAAHHADQKTEKQTYRDGRADRHLRGTGKGPGRREPRQGSIDQHNNPGQCIGRALTRLRDGTAVATTEPIQRLCDTGFRRCLFAVSMGSHQFSKPVEIPDCQGNKGLTQSNSRGGDRPHSPRYSATYVTPQTTGEVSTGNSDQSAPVAGINQIV